MQIDTARFSSSSIPARGASPLLLLQISRMVNTAQSAMDVLLCVALHKVLLLLPPSLLRRKQQLDPIQTDVYRIACPNPNIQIAQ